MQEDRDEMQPGLAARIEALLFVSTEPVSTLSLSSILDVDEEQVEAGCLALRNMLDGPEHGIELRRIAGGWRLFTKGAFHGIVEKYVISWDKRKLSQAALEALAIIAYSQPATRSDVAQISGVNSASAVNSLLEKGLIRESGFADTPGNPALYATTSRFLEHFGLSSLSELPDLESFAPDDTTRKLIRERLRSVQRDTGDE
ncbi:MAG: SMC-Scp complex subunit ScpB [Eggerthellaceae bacterium]|nr:SMC-Scp complex subunit ScpB [Eggerthellaceae bacterium]